MTIRYQVKTALLALATIIMSCVPARAGERRPKAAKKRPPPKLSGAWESSGALANSRIELGPGPDDGYEVIFTVDTCLNRSTLSLNGHWQGGALQLSEPLQALDGSSFQRLWVVHRRGKLILQPDIRPPWWDELRGAKEREITVRASAFRPTKRPHAASLETSRQPAVSGEADERGAVPSGHWMYDAVSGLAQDFVATGSPDGQFSGKRELPREEFIHAVRWILAEHPPEFTTTKQGSKERRADVERLIKLASYLHNELHASGVTDAALVQGIRRFRDLPYRRAPGCLETLPGL